VAGGLRIQEPAADLAAAAALVSSLANAALHADAVYFGKSPCRAWCGRCRRRRRAVKEAQKLGFPAFVPETSRGEAGDLALALTTVGPLLDLVAQIAPQGGGRRQAGRERK
jgi:DNA repair protein RadA/Sms